MKWALLLLLLGCGEMTQGECHGPAGQQCCPFDFINTFPAHQSCSPVGAPCYVNATDIACECETSGWGCHGTMPHPDLAMPTVD